MQTEIQICPKDRYEEFEPFENGVSWGFVGPHPNGGFQAVFCPNGDFGRAYVVTANAESWSEARGILERMFLAWRAHGPLDEAARLVKCWFISRAFNFNGYEGPTRLRDASYAVRLLYWLALRFRPVRALLQNWSRQLVWSRAAYVRRRAGLAGAS